MTSEQFYIVLMHNLYRTRSDADAQAVDTELSSRYVHLGFNMFRSIPCIVSGLPKSDVLHTLQIRMLDHFWKWIIHFMKMYKWLDQYNSSWLSMPVDHDLTPQNKSFEEVS